VPFSSLTLIKVALASLVALVEVVLGIIGAYKLRDGFKGLKSVFPEVGIGAIGGLILFVACILPILYPLIVPLVNIKHINTTTGKTTGRKFRGSRGIVHQ